MKNFLLKIKKIWLVTGNILGWMMTRVILVAVFYLIVTPIGFISRLLGNNLLNLKINTKESTYWLSKKEAEVDKDNYFKQY